MSLRGPLSDMDMDMSMSQLQRPHASLSVYSDLVSRSQPSVVLSSSASSHSHSSHSSASSSSSNSNSNSNSPDQHQPTSPPPTSPPSYASLQDPPDVPYFPSTSLSPSSPSTWATNMAHRQSSYAIAAYDLSSMPAIKTHSQMLWHQRQTRQSKRRVWFSRRASVSLGTLVEDEEYVSFLDLT